MPHKVLVASDPTILGAGYIYFRLDFEIYFWLVGHVVKQSV
jgi:hypothetical protein